MANVHVKEYIFSRRHSDESIFGGWVSAFGKRCKKQDQVNNADSAIIFLIYHWSVRLVKMVKLVQDVQIVQVVQVVQVV